MLFWWKRCSSTSSVSVREKSVSRSCMLPVPTAPLAWGRIHTHTRLVQCRVNLQRAHTHAERRQSRWRRHLVRPGVARCRPGRHAGLFSSSPLNHTYERSTACFFCSQTEIYSNSDLISVCLHIQHLRNVQRAIFDLFVNNVFCFFNLQNLTSSARARREHASSTSPIKLPRISRAQTSSGS